jgi:peptidyl-Lys metalloendopeptidase
MNAWIRKTFCWGIILAVFLSAFGGVNLKAAYAQEIVNETQPGATVSLSADQTSFGAAEDVVLHVTVANPGSEPVKILKWFTPFNNSLEPLFRVSVDGEPSAFVGAVYKRTAPTEQDYISLAAGESLTGDVNLGSYYDLSVSGNYTVNYSVNSDSLYLGDSSGRGLPAIAGSLSSNTVDLFVEGREISRSVTPDAQPSAAASNTFNSCSASRQNDLIAARNGASAYAADAVNYFSASQNGARYVTWFGAYDSARYNTARTHFSNIKTATDTAAINFDCTCTDAGTYAYVYPNEPYNVYLCGAFWSSPTTGTDSQAGTLIHELSHFTVLGGTDDYVYGQSGAKSLAISNPANAVMNADNHEYFAENNPPLEGTLYTISGNAGAAGAVLSYTDGASKTATADGSGNYAITIPSGWSGAVTPSLSGYTFTPANIQYSNVTSNQTAQNYTATGTGGTTYTISGNAGAAGAVLSYTDGISKTTTADGSGNYAITIPSGWSGAVTPSLSGYTFTPANTQYSNVTSNQTAQNYTATGTPVSANLFKDPSFEKYMTSSPWAQSSTNYGTPLCTNADCVYSGDIEYPRTGSVWGWFGGTSKNENGSLSQSVVFPTVSADLKFYLWISSAAPGSDASDLFAVTIDGAQVFSANATQAGSYSTYTLVDVDVSAFANGLKHVVKFSSTTTGQVVSFNLDDVSLTGVGIVPPTTQSKTFKSSGINDGWVLENSETGEKGGSVNSAYTYFNLGDDATDKQYRGILHFNTSALPDTAVITSVTLKIKKQGIVGTNPFDTHGDLLVDIRKPNFGATAFLAAGDFQAGSNLQSAMLFNPISVNGWYGAALGSSSYSFVNLTGSTQFRLRFTLDDNDDRSADYMKFFSGDYISKSLRPQLIVQYYVP